MYLRHLHGQGHDVPADCPSTVSETLVHALAIQVRLDLGEVDQGIDSNRASNKSYHGLLWALGRATGFREYHWLPYERQTFPYPPPSLWRFLFTGVCIHLEAVILRKLCERTVPNKRTHSDQTTGQLELGSAALTGPRRPWLTSVIRSFKICSPNFLNHTTKQAYEGNMQAEL
jgi:hypothetical protein